MKGSYILIIFLKNQIKINIGALGLIKFKQGFYFYVGSAMGSYGSTTLINRIKRHISINNNKKNHWHIDYLIENDHVSIVKIILIPSSFRLECIIAQELLDKSNDFIENFGSSDCLCKSHLIYFKQFNNLYTREE